MSVLKKKKTEHTGQPSCSGGSGYLITELGSYFEGFNRKPLRSPPVWLHSADRVSGESDRLKRRGRGRWVTGGMSGPGQQRLRELNWGKPWWSYKPSTLWWESKDWKNIPSDSSARPPHWLLDRVRFYLLIITERDIHRFLQRPSIWGDYHRISCWIFFRSRRRTPGAGRSWVWVTRCFSQ